MILAINTSGITNEAILYDGSSFHQISWKGGSSSNSLISQVESILSKGDYQISQIKDIIIYPGPGSYTGIRLGFVFCGALEFSQGSHVFMAESQDLKEEIRKLLNGHKFEKNILPIYR